MAQEWSLKTNRLTMRPLTVADAPALYQVVNDFDVVRMTSTWPWPVTMVYVEDRLKETAARDPERNTGLGIFADGVLAGSMGGHVEAHAGTGEEVIWIGYMLGRNWWGLGLMTEALRALCPWLLERLGSLDIYGEHFFDNPASGHVMLKAGFVHNGAAPEVWCKARQEKLPGEQYVLKQESLSG